ncbi:hypothetical protein XELAEV_18037264mg [Xenopus laevis]|uniref:Uncharacterized protein n=1 Tax=Xenopus laevis TaxID=8355 RepID=A0A974CCF7_XENLA|nr:hypothetical protein XELAEV_18037264mg [Xenopus laevis]
MLYIHNYRAPTFIGGLYYYRFILRQFLFPLFVMCLFLFDPNFSKSCKTNFSYISITFPSSWEGIKVDFPFTVLCFSFLHT